MRMMIAKGIGACTYCLMALGEICVLTLSSPLIVLSTIAFGALTFGDILAIMCGWYTDVFRRFIQGIKGL